MKIYAISDTHGQTGFTIPQCDLLIHAGDIFPDFRMRLPEHQYPLWLNRHFYPWLGSRAAHVICTWGNHDWTEEIDISPPVGFDEFEFLVDQATDIQGLKIYGTPWSNMFNRWAWMKEPAGLKAYYDQIPEGLDILISHQPPLGHGGTCTDPYSGQARELGSEELLEAIDRVQPKVVICGHIHSGYGKFKRGKTTIYNVAVLDELYDLVRGATEIQL
jgi:Icc-related predicted phosphoesterase